MKKPSRAKAVEHKCHDCMGEYADGMHDCEQPTCPLYTWMPYRKQEPVTDWQNWTPRGKGRRAPVTMSEEHKEEIQRKTKAGRARNAN